MSDSILVRVTLDSYDALYPSQRQTQVYVQIPEVARASWLLPAERYDGLKDRAWPEVMDVSAEHFARGWVSPDLTSAVARQVVMEWLRNDANRDEMQAAYELDQARRSTITRKLLAENGRLLDRVAELEKANEGLDDLRVRAIDKGDALRASLRDATEQIARLESDLGEATARVTELEAEREKLVRWHGEDGATINRLVARVERRQAQLVALRNDALSMRGSLSPADGARKVPFELGETLAPAVDWLIGRVAELEAAQGTAYRASHDSIVMGLYTTAAEARTHCETEMRRDTPPSLELDWIEDSEDDNAELVVVCSEGGRWTGYVVTPLEIAAAYDEEADE